MVLRGGRGTGRGSDSFLSACSAEICVLILPFDRIRGFAFAGLEHLRAPHVPGVPALDRLAEAVVRLESVDAIYRAK
jgi:hypothetical protein